MTVCRRFVVRVVSSGGLRAAVPGCLVLLALLAWVPCIQAEDKPDKAAEAAKAAEEAAAAAAAVKDATVGEKRDGDKKDGEKDDKSGVGAGEELSFRQKKISAEMNELEERMFRLSESLKELEPENASRLTIGLKFAREELIVHQMKELQAMLGELNLGEALVEEKQLVSKLERLHELLLSMDLDFQMQLEKLRQIREILRQLEKAIKEESREHKLSEETEAKRRELERLQRKETTLADLIAREKGHIEQTKPLAPLTELGESEQKSAEEVGQAQAATQKDTQTLADSEKEAGGQPENLTEAAGKMSGAAESLAGKQAGAALPKEEEALAALELEQEKNAQEMKRLQEELAKANFPGMKNDQMQNHQFSDKISELVAQLGETGAGAMNEMKRGSTSMGKAEGALGNQSPGEAGSEQMDATEALKSARSMLEDEAGKLLEQLRQEVRRRVLEGLTMMLERQIAVRESTELLGPKVAKGSRPAKTSVIGLAKSEGRIMDIADDLVTLVEETEFGIALPAALHVVRDAMADVQTSLTSGDASEKVVVAERDIEKDLEGLLEAMKKMPASKPSNKKARKGSPDREKELNRLIAELRMIRILQLRVNKETLDVDSKRPQDLDKLSAEIKQNIERVAEREDAIRDATERLAEERADELDGGN